MNYVQRLTLAAALLVVSGSAVASELSPRAPRKGGSDADAPGFFSRANLFGFQHAINGGYAAKEYVSNHVKAVIAVTGLAAALGHRYNSWFRNNVSQPVIDETVATAKGIRNGDGKSIAKGAGVVGLAALLYYRNEAKAFAGGFLKGNKKK